MKSLFLRYVVCSLVVLLGTAQFGWTAEDAPGEKVPRDDAVPPARLPEDSVVGRRVPNFVLSDSTGRQVALADFGDAKFVVVVFMGTACPIGNAYVPDLNDLQSRYRDQDVQVIGINSNLSDAAAAIAKHAAEYKLNFPVLVDAEQQAADLMGARRTPEAFVLDGRRNIRYRGRIDDRVGYDFKREESRRADLEEALKELLAGKKVSVEETRLEGCLITRSASLKRKGDITYAKHVSRILHTRCAKCHHPGTAAPFSLLNYEQARDWSEMIKETVVQRRMPPWNADPRFGKFSNDLRMTKQEIDTLVAWIDSGAPLGDRKDLPATPEYADGWMIGKPDVVFKMPTEYTVKAKGTVEYQYFVTPTNFEEDVWVQASEARPGNRAVVHHIIAFIRPKGTRGRRNMKGLGGFAPGEEPVVYPLGIGRKVPAGADIVWQVHYTPTGKVEKDRSEVGLIFCKERPQRSANGGGAFNLTFNIPAGAGHHRVVSRAHFSTDVELLSLMPHMHLRGKDFRYTAHYPNGKKEILLNVPDYDFNWQHRYRFAQPFRLPKGTTLECIAHFDNSADNPANPDPSKNVRWGDQTWEEMMIGWYSHVDAAQNAPVTAKEKPAEKKPEGTATEPATVKPPEVAGKREESQPPEAKKAQEETKPEEKVESPANSPDASATTKLETGRVLRRVYDFKEANKEMEYALYVPKNYEGTKSSPLIVALHGFGSNPRQILGYPGFTSHADKHGYILVAPMGYNSRGWYGSRGKGGGGRSGPENLGELSEKDVMNVLGLVRQELKIDDDRIYIFGHSMGGGGALHLAIRYPDVWAAIAPIAPAARRSTAGLASAKHIPAIVVQGDRDRLVPVTGTRRWIEKMKELEMDHRYIEVQGGGHVMVAFRYFDEIFKFFDARPKSKQQAAQAAESDS